MRKVSFGLFLVIALLVALGGCYLREEASDRIAGRVETLQETIPILHIAQHQIILTQRPSQAALFKLESDKADLFPDRFSADQPLVFWGDGTASGITLIAFDSLGQEIARLSLPLQPLSRPEHSLQQERTPKPNGFYLKEKATGAWSFYSLSFVNSMSVGQKSMLLGKLDNTAQYDTYLILLGAHDYWNMWTSFKASRGTIPPVQGGFFTGAPPILPPGTLVTDEQTGAPFDPHQGEEEGPDITPPVVNSVTISLVNPNPVEKGLPVNATVNVTATDERSDLKQTEIMLFAKLADAPSTAYQQVAETFVVAFPPQLTASVERVFTISTHAAPFTVPGDYVLQARATAEDVLGNKTPQMTASAAAGFVVSPSVSSPLTITQHPLSQTKTVGQSVTFTVSVTGGTPPYSHQWRKNGADIPGATGSSYTIASVELAHAGQYSVQVRDSSSPQQSLTSSNAHLTVQPLAHTDRFKIANSWGIGTGSNPWENVPDGFLYMTYESAKAVELDAWFFTPRPAYQPRAVAVIQMSHPVRNDTALFVGVGSPSSPRVEKKVYGLRDFGGPSYAAGGPYPYPEDKFVVDITEFLPLSNESVYLRVFDSNGAAQTGAIVHFSVETYVSYPGAMQSQYLSAGTPMNTINGASVSVSTPAISFSPITARETDRIQALLYQASVPLSMEMIDPAMIRRPSEMPRHTGEMGTGLLHPTEDQWRDIVEQGLARMVDAQRLLDLVGRDQPRSGVDHSLSPHFPPIGNQGYKGSCVSFHMGYYTSTFYLAREFGWNLSGATWSGSWPGAPSAAYQNQIMSPDFLFLQLLAYDASFSPPVWGSYYVDNIVALAQIGISSWQQTPYQANDPTNIAEYQGWPSEAAWRQAPLYRMTSNAPDQQTSWYLQVNTDTDIQALQALLDAGILISISVDADQYSTLSSEDLWDVHNYAPVGGGNHANTIVGYQ